jgi:hypothetical protein
MPIGSLTDFNCGHNLRHSFGMQQNVGCIEVAVAQKKRMAAKKKNLPDTRFASRPSPASIEAQWTGARLNP